MIFTQLHKRMNPFLTQSLTHTCDDVVLAIGSAAGEPGFIAPQKVYSLAFHQWSVVADGMSMVESMEVDVVFFSPHATHLNWCSMAVLSRPEHSDVFLWLCSPVMIGSEKVNCSIRTAE